MTGEQQTTDLPTLNGCSGLPNASWSTRTAPLLYLLTFCTRTGRPRDDAKRSVLGLAVAFASVHQQGGAKHGQRCQTETRSRKLHFRVFVSVGSVGR